MFDSLRGSWEELLAEHPHLDTAVATIRSFIPPINFITLHYAYFIVGSLVFSAIFWGSSDPNGSVPFIDSLFLVVSTFTNTGLNTVNLSELTTWQQVLLFILLIIGSPIWVSFWTVMARKHAFENRFDHIVEAERERRKRGRSSTSTAQTGAPFRQFFSFEKFKSSPPAMNTLPGLGTRQPVTEKESMPDIMETVGIPARRTVSAPREDIPSDHEDNASRASTLRFDTRPNTSRDHISFVNTLPQPNENGGTTSAYQPGNQIPHRINVHPPSTIESVGSDESEDFLMHWKKILTKDNTSKRGQFYDLTSDEREVLGGCEYLALKVLAVVVPLYGFLWQFLCAIALSTWIANNAPDAAKVNNQNPYWVGIFLSVAAFNNGGMSLLDANMIAFKSNYFPLIVVGTLVLAGNTAYPLFLRLILWSALKILQFTTAPTTLAPWKETVEFILKYPRRVYTTLFPSRPTWWLFCVLLVINITDWVAFEVLNIGNPVVESMSAGDRVIAGWFQAIVVRAAGFLVVSIPSLYPGVQLLYVIMMYISVYPVSITMRHSNIYEERSLGIYEDDPAVLDAETNSFLMPPSDPPTKNRLRRVATGATVLGKGVHKGLKHVVSFNGVGVRRPPKGSDDNSRISFLGQQIRGQLAHDLWWLVLPLLLIMIIETDHFLEQPVVYSVFNVLFEVVSAYGCVGLSVGVPTNSYSFAGGWHRGSKFVLCLVMLRGRHRGLPVALDKAVRLPGEQLHKEEEEDSRIRRTKTMGRIASRDM
ncbi:Fc.00g004640.m01.CDS01 [Cosmosporella sp. VM-42]